MTPSMETWAPTMIFRMGHSPLLPKDDPAMSFPTNLMRFPGRSPGLEPGAIRPWTPTRRIRQADRGTGRIGSSGDAWPRRVAPAASARAANITARASDLVGGGRSPAAARQRRLQSARYDQRAVAEALRSGQRRERGDGARGGLPDVVP